MEQLETSGKLKIYIHSSSEKGLSSVTTLVVGSKACILFDPPFLIPDSKNVVEEIKKHSDGLPLKAVFVTHHHPDHYLSANPILEVNPEAVFYAAPYVCAGIEREYDEKVDYWPKVVGSENVPARPQKPKPFEYSFLTLEGDLESPVFLLGPLQGDSVDHTLFWFPSEKAIVCGDAVYARSTHVWVEEIETEAILSAWIKTLDMIEALHPETIICGHLEQGWKLDAKADMEHNRKYLQLVADKITFAPKKLPVDELFQTFKNAFPQADKNLDFFLGHLSNQFGEGGEIWEENRHHAVGMRTLDQQTGFCIR